MADSDPGAQGNLDPAVDKTVNNDGNANDKAIDTSINWRSSLDTKDMEWLSSKGLAKDDTTPEQFAKTITKSYKELEALRGVDEKSLAKIPGKDATPEEKAAFYNKIGRPEAADKYEFAIPEGVKTMPEMVEWFKGAAFGKGLTSEQANGVLNDYLEFEKIKTTEYDDALKAIDAQDTATLRKEWGDNNYDKNIEIARRGGLAQGWTEEQLNSMANVIGKAALYKGLLSFGKSKTEDSRLEGEGVVNGQKYNSDTAKVKLNQLEKDRSFGEKYRAGDAEAVAMFKELNDIAYGDEPATRSGS